MVKWKDGFSFIRHCNSSSPFLQYFVLLPCCPNVLIQVYPRQLDLPSPFILYYIQCCMAQTSLVKPGSSFETHYLFFDFWSSLSWFNWCQSLHLYFIQKKLHPLSKQNMIKHGQRKRFFLSLDRTEYRIRLSF